MNAQHQLNQSMKPTQKPNLGLGKITQSIQNIPFEELISGRPNVVQKKNFQAMVEKRSGSKMFWNKRILSLKDGVLSYYSKANKPQQKQPNDNELIGTLAKSSVLVQNILYIGPPEKPKKPNCLEITFMAKDKIRADKGQKKQGNHPSLNNSLNTSFGKDMLASQQPIVITKKKEVIIWEFVFARPEDAQELQQTTIIEDIKNPPPPPAQKAVNANNDEEEFRLLQLEELRKQQAEQLEYERNMREKELRERLKAEQELEKWRMEQDKEIEGRKEEERRHAQEKQRLQQELLQQKEQERKRLLKEKEEFEKRQSLKKRLQVAWNYKFVQAIEMSHGQNTQEIEETVTQSIIMHKSIAEMKDHAVLVCSEIIDELVLPNDFKKYKPTSSIGEDRYFTKGTENSFQVDYNQKQEGISFGEDFYITDGLIIKLAYSQLRQIQIQMAQQEEGEINQSSYITKNIQIYDESSIKALGNGKITKTKFELKNLDI